MNIDDTILVKQFIKQSQNGVVEKECVDIRSIIIKYHQFAKYFKKLLNEFDNKNKTYTYMLTFTMDPKIHDVENTALHAEIEEYIIRFAFNRNAERADIVKEGTDEDHKHTHWHLGLELKKYIDFSTFLKFYRKTYGSVDISRSWSNQYINVMKYINKSNPSTELANIKP